LTPLRARLALLVLPPVPTTLAADQRVRSLRHWLPMLLEGEIWTEPSEEKSEEDE